MSSPTVSRRMRRVTDLGRVTDRARRSAKHARLRILPAAEAVHPLLLVVGCQRSGTTMLTELLDRHPSVRVHGELESLFDDVPRHHRMKDPTEVRRQLQRSGAAVDVVKPLVESHRVDELLQLECGAVALWLFRHYRDVAASNLRRFGIDNGRRNLRAIVEDDPADWRNMRITAELRDTVRSLYADDMPPHDAAALFWFCRNTLYFEQGLARDDRVRTCSYEELVTAPAPVLTALHAWLGLGQPAARVLQDVHARSVDKGRDLEFDPEIGGLCDEMWRRLLEVDDERSLTSAHVA